MPVVTSGALFLSRSLLWKSQPFSFISVSFAYYSMGLSEQAAGETAACSESLMLSSPHLAQTHLRPSHANAWKKHVAKKQAPLPCFMASLHLALAHHSPWWENRSKKKFQWWNGSLRALCSFFHPSSSFELTYPRYKTIFESMIFFFLKVGYVGFLEILIRTNSAYLKSIQNYNDFDMVQGNSGLSLVQNFSIYPQ